MQLNKVDQHIKAMMLTYPTLFKSRMDALKQLFMTTGNGYEWTADGCLSSCDDALATAMDYSDLDRRQQELDQQVGECDTDGSLARLFAARGAALKRLYAERRLIEADIDLYAAEHVMSDNDKYGVDWLDNFRPGSSAMGDAPYDALDPEWAAAAEETMEIARTAVWRHLHMHSPFFKRENADPKWLSLYDELGEVIDKLDATTGTQAKKARQMEFLKQHLARMEQKKQQGGQA